MSKWRFAWRNMTLPRELTLEECPHCGYSLRGLPIEHRCPECGFGLNRECRYFGYPVVLSVQHRLWIGLHLLCATALVAQVVLYACRAFQSRMPSQWLFRLGAIMFNLACQLVLLRLVRPGALRTLIGVAPDALCVFRNGKLVEKYEWRTIDLAERHLGKLHVQVGSTNVAIRASWLYHADVAKKVLEAINDRLEMERESHIRLADVLLKDRTPQR